MDNLKFLKSLLKHKWFVLVAGMQVGGIPWWRLVVHDWSKFLPSEFITYTNKFVRGNCTKEDWKRAWHHHIRFSPHHWEHWLLENEPRLMPETYVREMVADWYSASRCYVGSWDIKEWLEENYLEMRLHEKTVSILTHVLKERGVTLPAKI